jgi:transposase
MAVVIASPHDWKEARRWQALTLTHQGGKQQRSAEAFGGSKGAVSQGLARVREQGRAALRAQPRAGAPPRLTVLELSLRPDVLSCGAQAFGFRGEGWPCARVATVRKQVCGVSSPKAPGSRRLKPRPWPPQKPLERAVQREEAQGV